MAVAKSYQNLKQVGTPYKKGDDKSSKMYVQVLTNKGTLKEVRWYEDETKIPSAAVKIIDFDARRGWGFGDKGYVILLRGDEEKIKDWAMDAPLCRAWYNTLMKWYIPSSLDCIDVPSDINMYVISWDDIANLNNDERVNFFAQFA